MLRPNTCFIAESALNDQETNEAAAFNFLDEIQAVYPLALRRVAFMVIWGRDATDPAQYTGTFTLRLNGQLLVTTAVAIDFGNGRSHRTLIRVNGVIFQQPGSAEFSITVPPNVTARYVLTLQQAAPPVAQQAPAH